MTTQTITLSSSITRGGNQVSEITLHKPIVGSMRGINMRSVLDMNVDALITILPRISEPKLTEHEVNNLALHDLLQAGIVVASFFLPESEKLEVA